MSKYIFLLIPFVRKVQSKEIGIETANQFSAGLIGFMLLITGIGLYIVPSETTPSVLAIEPSQLEVSTSPPENSPITSPPQVTTIPSSQATSECIPPDGLVPLWQSDPVWSVGLWGSPNVLNFKSALGEIDTNDADYGEFSIWIDPCYAGTVPGHGYLDGGRFWPKQSGVGITSDPIPLGGFKETIIDDIPADTGVWGLGPQY